MFQSWQKPSGLHQEASHSPHAQKPCHAPSKGFSPKILAVKGSRSRGTNDIAEVTLRGQLWADPNGEGRALKH